MRKTNEIPLFSFHLAIVLLALFSLAQPLKAREKSDVIIMKNGDKITCEIKELQSNTLYISVDYILDTISVDWTKVDHVASTQLFLVKTQDGTVYRGVLSIPKTLGERPLQIEVLEAPGQKMTLERKQVVDVSQTSTNVWQRFSGEFGLGSTYAKGNQSTQYNLNTEIGYLEERWSAGVEYSSNLNKSSGSSASTRNDLTVSGRRLAQWKNWYYTGIADFLQSSAQGVQLASTYAGGIGRNIINTGGTFFTVYGGLGWQKISYHQAVISANTQNLASGLIGTSLELFKFDRTTLKVKANLLPAISDPGRFRFKLDSTYYVKLWGNLNWNITLYDNWDNRPPPGFSGSDYGATTGLSLTFGNR